MPDTSSSKKQLVEAILDNEALTDGLEDAEAQIVLRWAIDRIEAFVPTTDQPLDDYGQTIARQARTIARAANYIRDGDAPDRLRRYLQRLTDDEAQRQGFLRQLEPKRPLRDYIHSLCRLAKGQ